MIEEDIKGEVLDLNLQNILSSSPTAFSLRNLCFLNGFLRNLNKKERPRRAEYYERLLGFRTPINRNGRTLILLEARGKGLVNYDTDSAKSSSDFLKKQRYPDTVEELLFMNETENENGENLIEKYNRGIQDAYSWLDLHILEMERFPLGHEKFSKTLLYKILQINFPNILEEGDITCNGDSIKLIETIRILGV